VSESGIVKVTRICESLAELICHPMPPALMLGDVPKPLPLIVTLIVSPTGRSDGVISVITGAGCEMLARAATAALRIVLTIVQVIRGLKLAV
jgi:hypothetical protein